MPTSTPANFIYIGNFSDMDTDESDFDNENPGLVLGTHSTPTIVSVTQNDIDDDGAIMDDEMGTGDTLSYDAGAGATTVALDSTSIYNADILLGDGSTISQQVNVLQAANGDVFINEFSGASLDNLSFQSISLTSLVESNYAGAGIGSSVDNTSVVCFCPGTLIETPKGEVLVEDLRPGDLVTTLDHGPQEITWVNADTILHPGRNAPITLPVGSLGNGAPKLPLRVSPQHRILMRSRIANRIFGTDEVLVPAKFLRGVDEVGQAMSFMPVIYHHFACRTHEIVFANGAEAETFFPGPEALRALSDEAKSSLPADIHFIQPARQSVRGKAAHKLLWRHAINKRPLCERYCGAA